MSKNTQPAIDPESDDFFLAMCQTMLSGAQHFAGAIPTAEQQALQQQLNTVHTSESIRLTAQIGEGTKPTGEHPAEAPDHQ